MQEETMIIRFPALQKKLGKISRSTVDRWEQSNNFPKRLQLGKNSVGWCLNQVEQWLADRAKGNHNL